MELDTPKMSRSRVIETLNAMRFGNEAIVKFSEEEREALDYAVRSLETDEAYQLDFEGREAAKVIHARWLFPDRNYSTLIWRKCSNCNIHIEKYSKYTSFMGEVHYFENKYDYCPNCGAKMDLKEGQNEN